MLSGFVAKRKEEVYCIVDLFEVVCVKCATLGTRTLQQRRQLSAQHGDVFLLSLGTGILTVSAFGQLVGILTLKMQVKRSFEIAFYLHFMQVKRIFKGGGSASKKQF